MTSMMGAGEVSGEAILTRDARGRVRVSPERREALLDEFERSGATAAGFAAYVGVKYPTFANWVQRRRRARGQPQSLAAPLRWVEAEVGHEPAAAETPLLVHLPGGARLELRAKSQVELAAALLRWLERTTC